MRILAASVLLVVGFQVAFADGPAHLLKDINQTLAWDEMSSFPGGYHRLGGTTLFRARTRETGVELWRTDGTEAGTWLVRVRHSIAYRLICRLLSRICRPILGHPPKFFRLPG